MNKKPIQKQLQPSKATKQDEMRANQVDITKLFKEEDLQRHHYTILFLLCSWPLNQEHPAPIEREIAGEEEAQNYCKGRSQPKDSPSPFLSLHPAAQCEPPSLFTPVGL